ncbi:hypothetical protein Tco_0078387 [Tanacetum coccineum]
MVDKRRGRKNHHLEELVEKFFCKFYPESYDGEEEMLDEGNNWGIDPLEFISRVNSSFGNHGRLDGRTKKPYLKTREKNNTGKDDERRQTKRKCKDAYLEANNTSNTLNNERPNKRMCNADRFEAIKYSLRPNEEYIAIRRCEYDTWERNEYTMSQNYQEFFLEKGQRVEGDAHRMKKKRKEKV